MAFQSQPNSWVPSEIRHQECADSQKCKIGCARGGRKAGPHCAGEQNQLSAAMTTGRSYIMSTGAIQHQGKSFPLGATLTRDGANFSVFAKRNAAAQLLSPWS